MKRRLVNKLLAGALILSSILPLAGTIPVYADSKKKAGWDNESGKWYYYNENGEKEKNTTITEGNHKYTLGADGELVLMDYISTSQGNKAQNGVSYEDRYPETNQCSEEYKKSDDRWTNKDGNWYFDWNDGAENSNDVDMWDLINGYWYHFNKDGVMERNVTIKDECNNDCILNADGVLTNRSEPQLSNSACYIKKIEGGKEYYVNAQGQKQVGWIFDESTKKWYFANKDGVLQKNKTIIQENNKYILDKDGALIS